MPARLKRRCRFRGCPNTTRNQYCDEHATWANRAIARKRGTTTQRGYDADWKRVAQARRERDAYLCQVCRRAGRLSTSSLVDHIIPIHVRPDWRLEFGNTQVLCSACHGDKSGADLRTYGGRSGRELTSEQREKRRAAQRLERAPRDGDDE